MTSEGDQKNRVRRLAALTGTNYTTALRLLNKPTVPLNQRCPDRACISEDRMINKVLNAPDQWRDLADSAMGRCYWCGYAVCIMCQKVPVNDDGLGDDFCGPCADVATRQSWRAARDVAAERSGRPMGVWDVEYHADGKSGEARVVVPVVPGESGPTVDAVLLELRRDWLGSAWEPYQGPVMIGKVKSVRL